MAVDTRNKRASALGLALAVTLTLPAPDGTVGQPDRQHVAYSYAGIEAAEENIGTVADEYVENAPDALDSPGEWYLDRRTGVVRYWAHPGVAPNRATVTLRVWRKC